MHQKTKNTRSLNEFSKQRIRVLHKMLEQSSEVQQGIVNYEGEMLVSNIHWEKLR